MGRPRKVAKGVGERIASLVPSGGKLNEFAEQLGVSTTSFGAYVRGETDPPHSFYTRIHEKTGVDLNWLVTGETGPQSVAMPDAVAIPRFEIQASAGSGLQPASEDVAEFMYMARDWLSRFVPPSAKLGMIEARGDSMEPTIRDGEGLIIRFDIDQPMVENGGIFVINLNGAVMIKRLQVRHDKSVAIKSDNEFYDDEKLSADEANEILHVIAKVVFNIAPPRSQ